VPANIPPQAKAAEQRYINAKTLPEKIQYLQEFISSIPEHKGNEKMRGYLRRRLAKLKEEQDLQRRRKATGSGGGGFSIKKEGAAQIVILGTTGAGKSSILGSLTNAKVEVGDHLFATKEPAPGMLRYEDIQFQLLDTPAMFKGAYKGAAWGAQLLSLARNADGLLIVLDATDAVGQFNTIVKELTLAGITLDKRTRKIEIERSNGGGFQVACTGRILCGVDEIERVLKEAGVRNAIVRIWGDATKEDLMESLEQTRIYKPSLILINKADLVPNAPAEFEMATKRGAIGTSARLNRGLADVNKRLFESLGILRIYTKEVGGEPAKKPIIVKSGATVSDIAKIVHSQFFKQFKLARIWGSSVNYGGERVGSDHILEDKDIVEIRIK
jgi:ribosome-interacting GTPase 1